MDVDVGNHDEQDEADQPEELRSVSAARQPTELERRELEEETLERESSMLPGRV